MDATVLIIVVSLVAVAIGAFFLLGSRPSGPAKADDGTQQGKKSSSYKATETKKKGKSGSIPAKLLKKADTGSKAKVTICSHVPEVVTNRQPLFSHNLEVGETARSPSFLHKIIAQRCSSRCLLFQQRKIFGDHC